MISRTFKNKSNVIITKLYNSLVRLILHYCTQTWRPNLEKDVEILERVQMRATRILEKCKGLSFEKKLGLVGLFGVVCQL